MSNSQSPSIQKLQYQPICDPVSSKSPLADALAMSFNSAEIEQPSSEAVSATTAHQKVVQELEDRLAESQQQMKEVREQERKKTREQIEAAASSLVSNKLAQIDGVMQQISSERDAYFIKIEEEIVKLSLAIASRILHREAKIDPLFLAGAVRLALQQIQKGTKCALHVPAAEEDQWRSWLAQTAWGELDITIVPDASGTLCSIETQSGRINLAVEAQLAEIERGFLDLLKQRPSLVGAGCNQ